ncbi:HD domain-containing protein [bacterium]|nr:HD domain-containing protein [bacterium]
MSEIEPIIKDPFFQRLRSIKQLGLSEYVFPGATHSRFLHSLGVMEVGTRAFNKLFKDSQNGGELRRIKETFKLACMLHDIGHAPLSHATESVMPSLQELTLPTKFFDKKDASKQASHEDYTIKAIVDSSFRDSFKQVKSKFGVEPEMVADLIRGKCSDPSYFTLGQNNYFGLFHQLVSSEMDCDRMDYLLRDSYFCGVSYGHYDLDWLLDNLHICHDGGKTRLGISERAVVTFDDFLLSRYHMFVMVYFHYRSVCLEQLMLRYFHSDDREYSIPASIDDYLFHDDPYLQKIMRSSNNKYAKAVINNKIPKKVFESFNQNQLDQLESIQNYLEGENIDYIRCSSNGRLSKYYNETKKELEYSLQVVRSNPDKGTQNYFDISKATDLFSKFSTAHEINRLHVDLEDLKTAQKDQLLNYINQFH